MAPIPVMIPTAMASLVVLVAIGWVAMLDTLYPPKPAVVIIKYDDDPNREFPDACDVAAQELLIYVAHCNGCSAGIVTTECHNIPTSTFDTHVLSARNWLGASKDNIITNSNLLELLAIANKITERAIRAVDLDNSFNARCPNYHKRARKQPFIHRWPEFVAITIEQRDRVFKCWLLLLA